MRFPSIKSVKSSRSATSVKSDVSTILPNSPVAAGGLTVLHPSNDDGTALVDIITVHGLSGHPQHTWTNLDTQHYWPMESLPGDVPRARIMAFGYSTTISPFNQSTAIVSDVAKQLISHLINKRTSQDQKQRPIIFIAHSLGGIVVKEFLHVASNTGHEDLAGCVCGILFLGTPHKGSHLASFMGVISDVVKSLLGRSADAIIEDLSSNSRHLLELDQLLRFKLSKIDIYSFYELLPLKPLSRPVVERHSALLNLPSELEQIGLEADHRQMCRPADRNHFIYETIAQRILSIMNRQIHKAQYASDLVEMTNNFASKHMDHIAVLTKQMHECQIGSELKPMMGFLQHSVSLQFSQTKKSEEHPLSGFEEVLKSLPIREVKNFVNGIQRLLERAKSLQDLILMTERENERKRADARIEAERQASEERIRELMEENARLKARIMEQDIASAGATTPTVKHRSVQLKRGKAMNPYSKSKELPAVLKESIANSSNAKRSSARGGSIHHFVEDSSDDGTGSFEYFREKAEVKADSKIRKRARPPIVVSAQEKRRSKRQMSHYHGPTRTFELEEDSDFLFWGEADQFGPSNGLEKATGDGTKMNEDHATSTWSSPHAAEPYNFGPIPMAYSGPLNAGIFHGKLSNQAGHPSMELALEYATRPQGNSKSESHAELGVVRRAKRMPAWARLDTGGVQTEEDRAGNTEQEHKPEEGVQKPAEPMKTTQESKLVENMEHMQGMVEKLSLLLQAGQHAIGAHEAGVALTAQT